MKTAYLFFVILLIFSCNEAPDKANKREVEPSAVKAAKDPGNGTALKQNGDYSDLFLGNTTNCDFISTEEVAKVLEIDPDSIEQETNGCAYQVKDVNRTSTRFYFSRESWKKKDIINEIKGARENMESLGEDSRLTHIQLSETGDTYLAMNQNRYVMVLNEEYDGVLVVNYSPQIDPDEKDIAAINSRKDKARNSAYTLANYLLMKYKK